MGKEGRQSPKLEADRTSNLVYCEIRPYRTFAKNFELLIVFIFTCHLHETDESLFLRARD